MKWKDSPPYVGYILVAVGVLFFLLEILPKLI